MSVGPNPDTAEIKEMRHRFLRGRPWVYPPNRVATAKQEQGADREKYKETSYFDPDSYHVAYANCRNGLCKEADEAYMKCELQGDPFEDVEPHDNALQTGSLNCKPQKADLRECERHVLQPAINACMKEFRSYVFGMAEWYGPQGMDKKMMNHTVENTYDGDPFKDFLAHKHPELLSPERVAAHRYALWLHNHKVGKNEKAWQLRNLQLRQQMKITEPYRQAFLQCARNFHRAPLPSTAPLNAKLVPAKSHA